MKMTREVMRYKLNELRMMLNDGEHGEEQGVLVDIIKELDKAESDIKGDSIIRQAIEEINSEIPKIHELFDIAYEYNKEDSTRTELSQKCTTYLLDVWQTLGAIVDNYSPAEAKENTVSRAAFEQIMWERNVAIQQLKDLGYGLGEKPREGE